ncbi:MAG: RagB/SusD family nutrient uptake outer membrane protein [Tannerella sp.]|nr:RagB/SusD family nutrient uptake outer membrane protein [Tannerella sp.]
MAAFSVSCSDFLDVKPEEKPSQGTFFLNDKDATEALNACYNGLGDISGRELYWEQVGCGDDMIIGRTRDDNYHRMADFNFTGREGPINDASRFLANNIARCNWVIYTLNLKSTLSSVEQSRLGEAYFLRGFFHFYYAYRLGRADQGVPFDRYEDYNPYEYGIPEQRASVMENYGLIIQDFEKALTLVPLFENYSDADYGRAHKAACWGYMVKTYAYWAQHDPSKWALIPPLVDKMEQEGKRGLLDNYADVFLMASNWSKEYIWSAVSKGRGTSIGSVIPGVVLENKAWGMYNGWGYYKPTLNIYNEFAAGDKRRRVSLLEYNDEFTIFGTQRRFYSTSDDESGFMVNKFMDPISYGQVYPDGHGESPYLNTNGDWMTTDLNLPFMRHAEAVLFKAEALVMQGNGAAAATELNRLTARAGLGNVYTNATLADLKHERRVELAFELTDRFMDLKRWQDWDKLNEPRYVRKYADRSDPLSTWEPIISPSWGAARNFNPATDIVFPYNPDDVVKADGKLKQNPMD